MSRYPFGAELTFHRADIPFTHQFIEIVGRKKLLTSFRLILILLCIGRYEHEGKLKSPGNYTLMVYSYRRSALYRELPLNVN